jgi:mRNA interferase MazF
VVRIGRLAIVEANLLLGEIGEISTERLTRIRRRLADWIMGVLEFKSGIQGERVED